MLTLASSETSDIDQTAPSFQAKGKAGSSSP
jgi:hypothetical protein